MAACRGQIGVACFYRRGIAIQKGTVDLALVRMQQRYTKNSCEQSEEVFAGRGVGQAYQSYGLEESGWSCGEGTDATRELGGGPVATEATDTASSPKKLILIWVSTSTGLPST
jgi:hypothetical protein